jgi:hypothetical protein
MVRGWCITATFAVLLGACGSSETVDISPAFGPWQMEPVPLDPGLISAAEQACQASTAPPGPRTVAILHDERGLGLDTSVWTGQGRLAWCQVIGDGDGGATWITGGTGTRVIERLDPAAIQAEGWGLVSRLPGPPRAFISGFVGAGIPRVRIDLADGSSIYATVAGGAFYGWWPGESEPLALVAEDANGSAIGTFTP